MIHDRQVHRDPPSRRHFLRGLAVLGAGALFPDGHSLAQQTAKPRRIDVHHHFTPPTYLQFLKVHNQGGGVQAGPGGALSAAYAGWTLPEDLDDMDRSGTATAILSITAPGFWFGEVNEVRKVSRECNEYAAKLRSDIPTALAVSPLSRPPIPKELFVKWNMRSTR